MLTPRPKLPTLCRSISAVVSALAISWSANASAAHLGRDADLEPAFEDCGHEADAIGAPVIRTASDIVPPLSKSVAILGGQQSALELIRLAQEPREMDGPEATAALAGAEALLSQPLAPALGGMRRQSVCARSVSSVDNDVERTSDFLASKRLAISQTSFDRDWRRVSRDRISARTYQTLLSGAPSKSFSLLRTVNSWVNRAVAYTDDRDLFARTDFWAGAALTLRLRRGDCEDIALTKMQLLAAAGIPRKDMILTIARDLVRNADHAVLIVRFEGRYYLLDNATDEIFDADTSHDYRPILSFGDKQTWLHGY